MHRRIGAETQRCISWIDRLIAARLGLCKDLRCISWIDRLIAAHTPHTRIHTHMHAQTRIHCIKSKTSTWLWKNRHKVTTNIHISCCYMQEIYIHLVYMHIYISLVYILYITTYIHIFLYICINLGCTESERAIYIYKLYTYILLDAQRASDRPRHATAQLPPLHNSGSPSGRCMLQSSEGVKGTHGIEWSHVGRTGAGPGQVGMRLCGHVARHARR